MTPSGKPTDVFFQFSLARTLGMTVGELQTRMSSRELHWWKLFFQAEGDIAQERS